MSLSAARQLAHSLMFEGYVLYPYRQNALKNQKRLVFGTLYPATWAEREGERSGLRAELLVQSESVRIEVLFLHWAERRQDGAEPWREAQERVVPFGPLSLAALALGSEQLSFALPSSQWQAQGGRFESHTVAGSLRLSAEALGAGVFKLTIALQNRSALPPLPGQDDRTLAELMSFGAAHVIVHSDSGQLASLLDPPSGLEVAARACNQDGVWPVLVGDMADRRTLLLSPITLYDFPGLAPESHGDYCDATEIDEMLALRVRTMTEVERAQAMATDPRARQIIERSMSLTDDQLLSLHGTWREPAKALHSSLKPGDQVRLRPRPGRDVLDLALEGELATVLSLEQDFEGRQYCAVTVDADPGRDLGLTGQPGHRFFFDLDEVELAP